MSFGIRNCRSLGRSRNPSWLALVPLLGVPVGMFVVWLGHKLGWPGW